MGGRGQVSNPQRQGTRKCFADGGNGEQRTNCIWLPGSTAQRQRGLLELGPPFAGGGTHGNVPLTESILPPAGCCGGAPNTGSSPYPSSQPELHWQWLAMNPRPLPPQWDLPASPESDLEERHPERDVELPSCTIWPPGHSRKGARAGARGPASKAPSARRAARAQSPRSSLFQQTHSPLLAPSSQYHRIQLRCHISPSSSVVLRKCAERPPRR